MARRRKRRFGDEPEAHERRAEHAESKFLENADRAVELARKGTPASCRLATGALATAEYWRGRRDAEAGSSPKKGELFGESAKKLSSAYAVLSLKCWRDK